MILGIDVGHTGCLVVLDEEDHYRYIDHLHMPVIKVSSKTRVNGAAVASFVHKYELNMAYVELVNAMPNGDVSIGVASAFSFGHSSGVIEGVLSGGLIPYQAVTPTKWKRNAGLLIRGKDSSRSKAIQLYPELRELDLKAKGQALADAIFIARCAISPL